MPVRLRFARILVWVLAILTGAGARGQTTQGGADAVEAGRAATAMVDAGGRSFGSAFCIDRRGVFVTSKHVLNGVSDPAQIRIIVHPGLKDEHALVGEAVLSKNGLDVALVVVTPTEKLTALKLGRTQKLRETDAITAFGFPFGNAMVVEGADHPSVSVSTGKVTAMRRTPDGKVVAIQVDASLNPGNSGGPLVDSSGTVVGVATAGIAGAALNLALPVEVVEELSSSPMLVIARTLPAVEAGTAERPYVLKGRAFSLRGSRPIVEATFTPGNGKKSVATADGADGFRLSLPLNSAKAISSVLSYQVKIVAVSGEFTATAERQIPIRRDPGIRESVPAPLATNPRPEPERAKPGEPGGASPGKDLLSEPVPAAVFTTPELPDGKKVVSLPGAAEKVVLAGGGRFMLVPIPDDSVLAVVDVCEAKVVKVLPMMSPETLVAGNATLIVLADPKSKMFQRYSLRSFARELTAPLPTKGTPVAIAMGWQSVGPLAVCSGDDSYGGSLEFVNPRTLTVLPYQINNGQIRTGKGTQMRVSANGRRICTWGTRMSPSGVCLVTLRGDTAVASYEHDSRIPLRPTGDGLIYTSTMVLQSDLKTCLEGPTQNMLYVPAVDESMFLTVAIGDNAQRPQTSGPRIDMYVPGDHRPLCSLGEIEEAKDIVNMWTSSGVSNDERFTLVPPANVLVTLASGNRELVFRSVDVDALLAKSGVDYLFVRSRPAPSVRRGARLEHNLKIASKAGGASASLEHGPDGMRLTKEGVLSWSVPTSFAETSATVVVLLKDSTGQEKFFTFQLAVE